MAFKVNNLEGNEIGDYNRQKGERGRWGQSWDVFKANFGKIVLINLFVLLFFVPGIAVIVVRLMYVAAMGAQYPFNANTGIGYPVYPAVQGMTEGIYMSADILFYSILIVAGFIASVGIAGGAYSMKKLLNTQGKFTVKGFFHGVRVCYFSVLFPVTLFMSFLFCTKLIGDWKDLLAAQGGQTAGAVTAYVFIIIATVLVGIYGGWLIAVGTGYRLTVPQYFKNAFVLMISTPIQTVFFAGFSLIPVWLYMIGSSAQLVLIISYIVFIFIGFSFILIVWMSFTQWVFDMYVAPNYKKAEEAERAKKTPKELAEEKEEEEKRTARELLAAGRSELIGRPILPIAAASPKLLGKTYRRGGIADMESSREKLKGEIAAYEKEHSSDPVYAEYNRLFAEREKALQEPDSKKKKKKKVSADNLLR